MSQSDAVQRLQIRFAAEGPLQHVSHLDLMRVWERVCKRARLPLASSRGFSPKPKIALAVPLAVGVTSEAELLDVLLTERVEPTQAIHDVSRQLTTGLRILELRESPLKQPSLQSMVCSATYDVIVPSVRSADEWRNAITELLERSEIPWSHQRGSETKSYDLRPLIFELELVDLRQGAARLRMRLRNDERGAGRPEQALRALGAQEAPTRMHRTAIELTPPAVTAATE